MAYYGDNADSSRTGYGKGDAGTDKKRDGSDKKDVENVARGLFPNSYKDEAAARASRFSSQAEREAIARGDYSSAGIHENLKPGEGYTALTRGERFWAGLMGIFGSTQALGQVIGGGPAGIVSGAAVGKRAIANMQRAVTGHAFHGVDGKPMSGPSTGAAGQSKNTVHDRNGAEAMAENYFWKTTPVEPAEPVKPAIPSVFDYFTTAPRKKLGYQSTITPLKSKLGE